MACLCLKLKSTIPPWNTILKVKTPTLVKRIKGTIDLYVKHHDKVIERMILFKQQKQKL